MARDSERSVRPAAPRHPRDVHLHLLAVVIFGLLAWSGLAGLDRDVAGLAVPSLVVGVAGVVRAILAVTGTLPAPARPAARQLTRGIMALVAVAALTTGYLLAPSGLDRGFVIAVDAVLAGALAAYAFLGEPPRAVAAIR